MPSPDCGDVAPRCAALFLPRPSERAGDSNAPLPVPTGWGVWGVCVDRLLEGVGRVLEGVLEGALEAVGGGVTITVMASAILVRIRDGGPSDTMRIFPVANSRRMASARALLPTFAF